MKDHSRPKKKEGEKGVHDNLHKWGPVHEENDSLHLDHIKSAQNNITELVIESLASSESFKSRDHDRIMFATSRGRKPSKTRIKNHLLDKSDSVISSW